MGGSWQILIIYCQLTCWYSGEDCIVYHGSPQCLLVPEGWISLHDCVEHNGQGAITSDIESFSVVPSSFPCYPHRNADITKGSISTGWLEWQLKSILSCFLSDRVYNNWSLVGFPNNILTVRMQLKQIYLCGKCAVNLDQIFCLWQIDLATASFLSLVYAQSIARLFLVHKQEDGFLLTSHLALKSHVKTAKRRVIT